MVWARDVRASPGRFASTGSTFFAFFAWVIFDPLCELPRAVHLETMRFSPDTLCRVSQILTNETPEVLDALRDLLAKKKKPPETKRGWRRFPVEWQPGPAEVQLAHELRLDIARELAKIRDYEFKTVRQDPTATFRNWLRHAAQDDWGPRVAPRQQLQAVPSETLLERAERIAREASEKVG